MKNKMKLTFSMTGAVLVVFIAGIMIFPGAEQMATGNENYKRDMANLPALEFLPGVNHGGETGESGNPAVESILNRLVNIYNSDGPGAAEEFAAKHKIPFKDGQILVELDANPFFLPMAPRKWAETGDPLDLQAREAAINQAVSLVRAGIEGLGGRVVRTYRSLVQCRLGIQSLGDLARLPLVQTIRRPLKPIKHATSEGVEKTGANHYHNLAPFKSTGAKVMVLDVGFQGYRDLLGTDLPNTVTTRSFTDTGDLEAEEIHGTACAEIVHDMAPDADLYLANIYWDSDLIDAVEWAVEQKIDIISYSLGTYFGAGDGTGLDSALAKWAYENAGITWVTSAGNAADDHWSGTFNDTDGDGWHNFSSDDEILSFFVPAGLGIDYGVDVYLKWNDWGTWDDYYGYSGTNQDYDLYLFIWTGSEWYFVDSSENRQPQFIYPWESIEGWYALFDAYWGVALRKKQATTNVTFDLYILTHSQGSLEYSVPAGSLSAPADSPYVIAVGAVDAEGDYYHYYSSQGPTADGRIKPDLCAPSGVSTSDITYGSKTVTDGFNGTSASCPHVAGALALLKGKTPFTLDEIKNILYYRAIDMGTAGMDNIYGRGRLSLYNK